MKIYLKYLTGVILFLACVAEISETNYLSAIIYLLGGVIAFPLTLTTIEKKLDTKFDSILKYTLVLGSIILASKINNPTFIKNQDKNETENKKMEELKNINLIAGKNLADVKKYLGEPENIENVYPSSTPCSEKHPCKDVTFENGKYKVLFINGKADWITYYKLNAFDFNDSILVEIGLPASTPTEQNQFRWLWNYINDYEQIIAFPEYVVGGGEKTGKCNYLIVKVKTP